MFEMVNPQTDARTRGRLRVLRVQVTGDLTIDWMNVGKGTPAGGTYYWTPGHSGDWHLSSRVGCAGLVQELVSELVPAGQIQLQGPLADKAGVLNACKHDPKNHLISTSWTVWRPVTDKKNEENERVRLHEWRERETITENYTDFKLEGSTDLLVIVDTGQRFRECPTDWPEALNDENLRHEIKRIILKLSQFSKPGQDAVLRYLIENGLGSRTTVVTSVGDLRACAVKIGRSLSWDHAFEEIVRAVRTLPQFRKNGQFAVDQVVVTMGTAGAVLFNQEGISSLIFDKSGQEGDFARNLTGEVMGATTCVVSSLVAEWAERSDRAEGLAASLTSEAVWHGVGLARFLLDHGYLLKAKSPSEVDNKHKEIMFPAAALKEAYEYGKLCGIPHRGQPDALPKCVRLVNHELVWNLGRFDVETDRIDRLFEDKKWSILEQTILKPSGNGQEKEATKLWLEAIDIVTDGPKKALEGVPIEEVGDWLSADRHEIEGVRSVNNAIREYLDDSSKQSPLCIGVFGPPGAGKSFAIQQIARKLKIPEDAELTFNLSQFSSPAELTAAFHQIRDVNLRGKVKVPLVFWDEFDTPCDGKPFGWLRYFLSPMHEGEFMENGRTHPLGGGIFVFAGATRHSFEQFRAGDGEVERAAKKPDFVSRLRAYINVQGPNPDPDSFRDKMYIIRRAVLLNSTLHRRAKQLINAETGKVEAQQGVLNAFLRVPRYLHGARSMDTLVRMSALNQRLVYELSSLPPTTILAMHVAEDHFKTLMLGTEKGTNLVSVGLHVGELPAVAGAKSGEQSPEVVEAAKLKPDVVARAMFDYLKAELPNSEVTFVASAMTSVSRSLLKELATGTREVKSRIAALTVPVKPRRRSLAEVVDEVDPCKTCHGHRDDCLNYRTMKPSPFEVVQALDECQGSAERCNTELGRYAASVADCLMIVSGSNPDEQSAWAPVIAAAKDRPVLHVNSQTGVLHKWENSSWKELDRD